MNLAPSHCSTASRSLTVALLAPLSVALISCDSDPELSATAGGMSAPAGMTPQTAGMTPQTAGMTPQPAGMTPQPSGMTPQPAGMEPQPAGTEPQPAGTEPQTSGVSEPQGGAQPGQTPLAPETPITACEDFGSTLCFANEDCNPDGRCQSVESEDELPCCVRGERGTSETGAACTVTDGQLTCASSLCITALDGESGYCSGTCESNADCPPTLPLCIPIAFSGSDSQWCTPAN